MQENNHYKNNQSFYVNQYWSNNDGSNLYRPNGFQSLPESIYRAFVAEVDKDGTALDLGCGNGLMLKYLMLTSGYKLIPYGVDFMELSIKQAKEIIHPQYKTNFITGNVINYSFDKGPFSFIFVPLHHICPDDRKEYLNKIKKSCQKNGKIIFYEYTDALNAEGQEWIGAYPELKHWKIQRKDYCGISVGVWQNN